MVQLLLPRLVQSMVNEVTVRLNLLALFTQPVTVTELLAWVRVRVNDYVYTCDRLSNFEVPRPLTLTDFPLPYNRCMQQLCGWLLLVTKSD